MVPPTKSSGILEVLPVQRIEMNYTMSQLSKVIWKQSFDIRHQKPSAEEDSGMAPRNSGQYANNNRASPEAKGRPKISGLRLKIAEDALISGSPTFSHSVH